MSEAEQPKQEETPFTAAAEAVADRPPIDSVPLQEGERFFGGVVEGLPAEPQAVTGAEPSWSPSDPAPTFQPLRDDPVVLRSDIDILRSEFGNLLQVVSKAVDMLDKQGKDIIQLKQVAAEMGFKITDQTVKPAGSLI